MRCTDRIKRMMRAVILITAGSFLYEFGAAHAGVVRPAPLRPASPRAELVKSSLSPTDEAPVSDEKSIGIEFRPRAEIETSRVMLDQIAFCVPARTRQHDCAEILAVDAGISPAPGKTGRISRAAIMEILNNEFPGTRIEVLGPESSFVTSRGIPLSDEALAVPFRDQMDEAFSGAIDFRVQVSGIRIESRPPVRPGAISCRFAQLELLKQRMAEPAGASIESNLESLVTRIHNGAQFNAQCTQAGAEDGDAALFVQFLPRIIVERQMPVARRDLPAKTIFVAEDAVLAWIPWTRSAARALREASSLAGMSLIRQVQAGRMLNLNDFERPLAVRRGDNVQLMQKSGELTISGNAVVITQGAVGERIEVQSTATKKRLRAVVRSNSTVEAM